MQRLKQRKSSYSTKRFLGCEIAKAVGASLHAHIIRALQNVFVRYLQVIVFHFKADEIQQLIKRNVDFMSANSIEGTVSVSQAAVFVSNVRDRMISGMKYIFKGCK